MEVSMMPAACFFGDHDNLFCLCWIVSRRSLKSTPFKDIYSDHNLFKTFKNILSLTIDSKLSSIQQIELLDIDCEWKDKNNS